MQTVTLSENAVAVLRFEIKGWRAKNQESRLPAYRELAAAGVMEPVPGSEWEYRFTAPGWERREEILRDEEDRIERERFEPPDTGRLSETARAVLRRISSDERVEITTGNRPAFRELAAARIIILRHTFARGYESGYRFTYWGSKQRLEVLDCVKSEARERNSRRDPPGRREHGRRGGNPRDCESGGGSARNGLIRRVFHGVEHKSTWPGCDVGTPVDVLFNLART